MATKDFEFHIKGLEIAILDILKNGDTAHGIPAMSGIKEFSTYSGELDRANVIDAIKRTANRFPLVMVAYGSGADKRKAATGLLLNEPIENEHSCGFVVVVASSDLRGETKRRTSVYTMISQVRKLIGGIQFEVESDDESIMLNHSPFLPAGVECISLMKDMTVYAVHFNTMFHEWLPDRRVIPVSVETIQLNVFTENNNLPEFNLPGVTGE